MLEVSRRVSKSEGHYRPFKGPISGSEGGFPFIPFSDADEVVSMSEVYFREYPSPTGAVEEVGYPGQRIVVFLRDFVQASEVDA